MSGMRFWLSLIPREKISSDSSPAPPFGTGCLFLIFSPAAYWLSRKCGAGLGLTPSLCLEFHLDAPTRAGGRSLRSGIGHDRLQGSDVEHSANEERKTRSRSLNAAAVAALNEVYSRAAK
jgi:hypothetical protein